MENYEVGKDLLREKSFTFAVRILKLNKYMTEEKREFVISKQLLRAGTNPGAMVREAAYAESADDFIHKLAIARKEFFQKLNIPRFLRMPRKLLNYLQVQSKPSVLTTKNKTTFEHLVINYH